MPCLSLKKVWLSRISFICCLVGSAVVLGWAAFYFLRASEQQLGQSQFTAIAERALDNAEDVTRRRRSAAETLASLYADLYPDAAEWPFVSLPHFNKVATGISMTSSGYRSDESSGQSLGISIFISDEDQVQEFNEFQADYMDRYFPPARPIHEFLLPDGSVVPVAPSRCNVTAPLSAMGGNREKFQSSMMLDLFSTPVFRPVIDHYLKGNSTTNSLCGVFSRPVLDPDHLYLENGPVSHYTRPIVPANSPSAVVGMVVTEFQWNLVFYDLFSTEISGIDCVLESLDGSIVHTFEIRNGLPHYKGPGDLHKPYDEDLGVSVDLTDGLCHPPDDFDDSYDNGSVEYRLTIYPTTTYYSSFYTRNPSIASIGAVLVIAFTSFLFWVYDGSVRKDMDQQQTIIQAKKTFLRFVSHEVRTPLNTISMGLKLICDDVRVLFSEEHEAKTHDGPPPPTVSLTPASAPRSKTNGVWVTQDQAERILELASQINVSADSAVEILSDVLSYDKIESGKLNLELTYFPLWDLLVRIAGEFKVPAQAKKVELTWHNLDLEEASSSNVAADALRLAQVIRNLISNAIKFTPTGGSICIDVQWSPDSDLEFGRNNNIDPVDLRDMKQFGDCKQNGEIRVRITDSGVGMTIDQVSSIFGQGVQFNANSLQGGKGSGLGLFIAKGIVEQHGGVLSVSSEGMDCGSTFTMVLPVYAIPNETPTLFVDVSQKVKSAASIKSSSEPTISTTSDFVSSARPSHSQLTALIVDDALMNRKLLSRLLEKRGWGCDCAENGQVAVDLVKAKLADNVPAYDCILLDYEMPVMNGPEAARIMRAMGCGSCLIGVTGNVLPEDISHFVACGAASVFCKPVNIEELEVFWREVGLLPSEHLEHSENRV